MSYKIIWENQGMLFKYTDKTISFNQVNSSNNRFLEDPRSDTAKYQLVDCSGVQELNLDIRQIEYIAAIDHASNYYIKHIFVALVGCSKSVIEVFENYKRISGHLGTNWDIQHFMDINAARHWLEQQDFYQYRIHGLA